MSPRVIVMVGVIVVRVRIMGHAEVARRASRLLDQRQPLRLRLVRDRDRVRVRGRVRG